MNFKLLAITLVITSLGVQNSVAGQREVASAVIQSYQPGSTGYGPMSAKTVTIDANRRTITIDCNENVTYLPLTSETMAALKADIIKAFGPKYKNYTVKLTSGNTDLDDLVLFARKSNIGPTETSRFITPVENFPAPAGLDGANIALWQSHGWYFEPKLNRWEWQRARVMQTVEDLYTQSYVMPFLMPMLENAGAYVMSPRERDINLTEIIIDGDSPSTTPGYSESHGAQPWTQASASGFAWDGQPLRNGSHPFSDGHARKVKTVAPGEKTSQAIWSADIPKTDTYAVYISYSPERNNATDASYTIHTAVGDRHFKVNQQMGAGTWIYLGHFPLNAGKSIPVVTLTNESSTTGSVVTADAVKIGGGMNVVERIVKEPLDSIDYQYVGSGYPKFVEGARYFLQWAGAPDSVFTPSDYVNDYNDDYRSRGLWVNWLAGGSSMLPQREGLGIPVDLSFAFHTDAGTFRDDSIVGTLGIYCTSGDTLGNGSSRLASRDLTNLVMTNLVNDVRAKFEPHWSRRAMWDKSYFEARVPEVPAMLLEFLSHQNFADMKYGLDPAFRFVASRAIYKGMLQFIAARDGRPYIVQPLPVKDFAITPMNAKRTYRLSWAETVDSLEESAHPSYYIIQQRIADEPGFTTIASVDAPYYDIHISDNLIHSYRIIAGNDGGVSFPSEILAVCDLDNGTQPVLVVNGFTRVSGPDWFEASEGIAGFYDTRDHGVPYIYDISFIGSQFEFRRDIPWMDDDAAGFGASRADYEEKVIAGNTFDYVYTHGKAIVNAGYSFYSSSVSAYMASDPATESRIVDLILGKQKEIKHGTGAYGTYFKTFPSALQDKIANAVSIGTSFFVSGAFVATDLWDNPNSTPETAMADQKFATDILGYHWRVGQASVTGDAYEVPCRFKEFTGGQFKFSNALNSECYAVESPDSFYAPDTKRGCTLMRYNENNLIAATANAFEKYRTVVIGFPFETITDDDARTSLMSQILNFFSNINPK
ncbi:MAG: xanthan lyase [Odoribacter sp.]|nr:xanthan lyase [Odoribacter sp.]